MKDEIREIVLKSTGARALGEKELIQELWSGYGEIIRIALLGAERESVIVKNVHWPKVKKHPRGWNSDLGHQRKLKSYQVETAWYQYYSKLSKARLPQCLALQPEQDEVLMVLEDLDAAGYPLRYKSLSWEGIRPCLQWLAEFHASYLGMDPEALWEVGTYWHLVTRPQELAALADKKLKGAAAQIDEKLNSCRYKTLVHGDAKLANFCFSKDGEVAGLDFQYVGGGCGMKDLAYFIGSCLEEENCARLEDEILDTYFNYLQKALAESNEALEKEWRALYRVAWADFHRFIKGWSPGHWKINGYSEAICAEVIKNL